MLYNMGINRDNYEQVLIDYFDGRLGAIETAALMAFLEENPDIREEFDNYENISLEGDHCIFQEKDQLKHTVTPEQELITESNYVEVFFKEAEGLLDDNMQQHVKSFLDNNPSLILEYYSWRTAHLISDPIVFNRKDRIKRSVLFPFFRKEVASAAMAAFIALLIISGIFILQTPDSGRNPALSFVKQSPVQQNKVVTAKEIRKSIAPVASQNVYAVYHPEKSQKSAAQKKDQSLLASGNITVDRMIVKAANTVGSGSSFNAPDRISGYQNEYTEILQLIDIQQKIKKNDNAPQYARNDEENSNSAGNGKTRISFWDVAEFGIAGYNALTSKEVNYKRRVDAHGRTSAVCFGAFAYERR